MPAALQSNKSRASVATSAYAGVEKILGTHLGVDGPIQLHEHIVRGLPQQSMVQLIDRLIIIDCDSGLRAVGTSRSTWHRQGHTRLRSQLASLEPGRGSGHGGRTAGKQGRSRALAFESGNRLGFAQANRSDGKPSGR
jgi:hypothetical protein